MDLSSLAKRAYHSMPLEGLRRRIRRLGTVDQQWLRVVMDQHTIEEVARLRPSDASVLEISGRQWQKRFPFKSYVSVSYPEFDICNTKLEDKFDLIIAEQVFEHLLWPYRAGRNVFDMLSPGGRFLITTPFLIRRHDTPHDCSRWTEVGLKYFLAECGFDLEEISSYCWGNRACLEANLSHWAFYRPRFHSLKNESNYPLVVWAIARKRG
jgi:SAM-dependent methyltransferase